MRRDGTYRGGSKHGGYLGGNGLWNRGPEAFGCRTGVSRGQAGDLHNRARGR